MMSADETPTRQRQASRQAGGSKGARDTSSTRSTRSATSRSTASRSAGAKAAGSRRGAQAETEAETGAQARASTGRAASRKSTGAARGVSKAAGTSRGSGTSRASGAARGGKTLDAVAFLKQDHKTVDGLFKQFEEASDGRTRSSIMRKIAQALRVHTQIEEELFYPAARQELSDQDLLNEAQVEHDSLKRLIEEIEAMRPSEQLYKAKVTVLKEYVKHHVKEEEREMFPLIKQTDLDLEALGEELAARHQELMRGGGAGRGRGRRAGAETGVQLRG